MTKKPVSLTSIAQWQLLQLLSYLSEEWSVKIRDEFLEKFKKAIEQIQLFPEACQEVKYRKNVRRKIVTEQNSIYYTEFENEILVLAIFDNRQDPKKTLKSIKKTFGYMV